MPKGTGLRYNAGKPRLSLIPQRPLEEIAKVFTYGAGKYTHTKEDGSVVDGSNNWRGGMPWTSVADSMLRHINSWLQGEDEDKESGLHHLAHAATNALFLMEYQQIYPQGDDRQHPWLSQLKWGLDIDGVIADTHRHIYEYNGLEFSPSSNWRDAMFLGLWDKVKFDTEFWKDVPPLVDPSTIPFEVSCYVTSRDTVNDETTREWIKNNGFPDVPIHYCYHGKSKGYMLVELGIDAFVEDNFNNFVDINRAGVLCYLMDTHHNGRYDVGNRRIKTLSELS